MKIIIYLLVCLICSCSVKRKLKESTKSIKNVASETQTLQTQQKNGLSHKLITNSSNYAHWLKLYPKGNFTVNKDGFQGLADSLVWYGNAQQVSIHQQLEKQSLKKSSGQVLKQIETETVKEQKKELIKTELSIWWILGGSIAICITIGYYKYIRRA